MLPYSYLVLGVDPVSNEANVELSTKITITFAKPINTDTLNTNTVRLRKVNGDFVEYTAQYNFTDKTYVLVPTTQLEPNTQYQTMILGGTEGVLAIDGGYLPSTKTYEFVTVQREGVSNLSNLIVSQEYLFASAKWDMPTGLMDGEEVFFNVRLSTSNNPEAFDLWPTNPVEGKTTATTFVIPYKLEPEKNYYVHVQAVTKAKTTGWVTGQVYIEPILSPTTPTPVEPETPPDVSVGKQQLTVLDQYPLKDEIATPSEVVIMFSDGLPSNLFGVDQPEQNPLFYVVQAPYKKQLTPIDTRSAYSPKNALKGSISLDSESPNVLVWTPKSGSSAFLEGKDYTVVISKNLAGVNTLPIGFTYSFGFQSRPEHFHGDIEQIRGMMGSLSSKMSTSFLHSLMKKHSQFACDIWEQSSTYDESLHQDGEAPSYVHEYVNTQVCIDAILSGGLSTSATGNESMTLGQLQVSKGTGSSNGASSIKSMLGQLTSQLKKWEDLIHGHHNRGYATPGNVVKGENAATLPTYITRTNMNTSFDG